MLNLKSLIASIHAALDAAVAKAQTVSSEIIAGCSEVRSLAVAASQWLPSDEAKYASNVAKLTGDVVTELPKVVPTVLQLAKVADDATAPVELLPPMTVAEAHVALAAPVAQAAPAAESTGSPAPQPAAKDTAPVSTESAAAT